MKSIVNFGRRFFNSHRATFIAVWVVVVDIAYKAGELYLTTGHISKAAIAQIAVTLALGYMKSARKPAAPSDTKTDDQSSSDQS